MPRGDQLARQWHILRRLEGRRGATLHELAAALPDDFPKHLRTLRRDLEALEAAGYPMATERVDGQTRWRLLDGVRAPAIGSARPPRDVPRVRLPPSPPVATLAPIAGTPGRSRAWRRVRRRWRPCARAETDGFTQDAQERDGEAPIAAA